MALVLATLTAGLLTTAPAQALITDFPVGVASRAGIRSAMLWTKADTPGEYVWQVSRKADFSTMADSGVVQWRGAHNGTMKPVAYGLQPGTVYYYRFKSPLDELSPRGTFRTLPPRTEPARFEIALTGDSDVVWDPATPGAVSKDPSPWPTGVTEPFQVLNRVREDRTDLFLYMGDTIYSDSESGAPLATTVQEKWQKYFNNRQVPAVSNLLKSVSTWAVWDDHEVVNDFDGVTLANSDPNLLRAGVDAFNDYWPIQESSYYRKVDLGSNADLIFLDERSYRTESPDVAATCVRPDNNELDLVPTLPQADRDELNPSLALPPPGCVDHMNDPNRTMLGKTQLAWLKQQLRTSTAKWKLIVNEVPIQQLFILPYDRWEGYAAERANLLNFIKNRNIKGVVFLTTDLHANIGGKVYVDTTDPSEPPVAYEIIAGPIQTCTVACEIDDLTGGGSGFIRQFLLSRSYLQGAKTPQCSAINTYAYATISQIAGEKLKLVYKSADPSTGGGEVMLNECGPKTLSN
jgi:alkaline phosphatase D